MKKICLHDLRLCLRSAKKAPENCPVCGAPAEKFTEQSGDMSSGLPSML